MSANPLRRVGELGQSVWYDYIRRDLVTSGELTRLIEEDGLHGMTSNPTIFQKAIAETSLYDDDIRGHAARGKDPAAIFETLAVSDVQRAADVFRAVYDRSNGRDGFVSIEVAPRLAHDTEGSIEEARRLWRECDRPNVMVKIPGTAEGLPAVETCLAEGININITLLFSVDMYWQVALAYMAGLERRRAGGQPLDRVASVASFFVSRIDTVIDPLLPDGSPLRGQVAIANAKRAYQHFLHLFSGDRWGRLAEAGARVQRPLWASTGTKNPAYSDVLYVEALIGPDTVNTMPEATLDAFRDHGRIRPDAVLEKRLEPDGTLALLAEQAIGLDTVTAQLLDDGLAAFDADLAKIVGAIESKLEAARSAA